MTFTSQWIVNLRIIWNFWVLIKKINSLLIPVTSVCAGWYFYLQKICFIRDSIKDYFLRPIELVRALSTLKCRFRAKCNSFWCICRIFFNKTSDNNFLLKQFGLPQNKFYYDLINEGEESVLSRFWFYWKNLKFFSLVTAFCWTPRINAKIFIESFTPFVWGEDVTLWNNSSASRSGCLFEDSQLFFNSMKTASRCSVAKHVESETDKTEGFWSCHILQKHLHWNYNRFIPTTSNLSLICLEENCPAYVNSDWNKYLAAEKKQHWTLLFRLNIGPY